MIVVDDGSPAPVSLEMDRVSVIRCDVNRGPGPAINTALEELRGDLIVARLDCRDWWFPYQKEIQIASVVDHGRASFSWTFDPISESVREPHPRWRTRMFTDNQFASSGVVFPLSVWRDVGGYDEHLRWGEDWDFAMKVQRTSRWVEFPSITAVHGEHPGGLSDVSGNSQKAAARERDISIVRDRARSYR